MSALADISGPKSSVIRAACRQCDSKATRVFSVVWEHQAGALENCSEMSRVWTVTRLALANVTLTRLKVAWEMISVFQHVSIGVSLSKSLKVKAFTYLARNF